MPANAATREAGSQAKRRTCAAEASRALPPGFVLGSRNDLWSVDRRPDAHAFYARTGFESRARAFTKRL